MNYYFVLLLSLLLFSCDSNVKTKEEIDLILRSQAGITLSRYQLVNSEDNSSVGDFSKSFLIKFDEINFNRIVIQITDLKERNVNNFKWMEYENGWKLERNLGKGEIIYLYVVKKKRTLSYLYVEE